MSSPDPRGSRRSCDRPGLRTTVAVIVTVGTTLVLPPAASAAEPKLYTGHGARSFAVKPTWLVHSGNGSAVAGGFDGTGRATQGQAKRWGRITWTRWGRREATATGAIWLNDCVPYCAKGTYVPTPVSISAKRVRRGRFTRLALTYVLDGETVTDRRILRRPQPSEYGPGGYSWVSP